MHEKDEKQRGKGLADRFRAALDRRSDTVANQRAEAAKLRTLLQQERASLMVDLRAFGESIGHFAVDTSRPDRLALSHEDRHLVFDASNDEGRVDVQGDIPGTCSLEYESRLKTWVLVYEPPVGQPDKSILFDRGLTFLVSKAFSLHGIFGGDDL